MYVRKRIVIAGTQPSPQFIKLGLIRPEAQTKLPSPHGSSIWESSAAEKLADPLLIASLGRLLGNMYIRRRRGFEDRFHAAHAPIAVRGKSTLDEGSIIEGTSEAFSRLGSTLLHFSSAKSFNGIRDEQNSQLRLVIDALKFSAGYPSFANGSRRLPVEGTAAQLAAHLYEKLYKTGKLLSLFNSGLYRCSVSQQELEALVKASPYLYSLELSSIARKHCVSRHPEAVERLKLLGRAAADLFYVARQFGIE